MGEKRKTMVQKRTMVGDNRKKMTAERPRTATSTAAIAHQTDILIEIFLLLPAKSVIRFKSVCKHWHSIISDDSFSNLHTRRRGKPQTSFLLRASPSEFFYFNPRIKKLVPKPLHINHAQTKIRQSCNGLLLLECGSPNKDYYILNPTTGKSRNLFVKKGNFFEMYLEFDPSKSLQYKVICLTNTNNPTHNFSIELYDSKTHTWKRHEKVHQTPLLLPCVYWNNCLHWKTEKGRPLCLDSETLTFRTPPLDIFRIREEVGAVDTAEIKESGGSVHYIGSKDVINRLQVYEVREDGCDWSMKGTVDFDSVTASSGAMPRAGICLMGAVEEEWSLVFHFPGKIMVYRFKEGRFEEVVDLRKQKFYRGGGGLQFGWGDAYQFVESLSPV